MERVDSEEEEEEVVIHLTSANPQVKGWRFEEEKLFRAQHMIIELRRDKFQEWIWPSWLMNMKLKQINDFPGLDEPNSKMGLGYQIVHSSLFSKWAEKMTLMMMALGKCHSWWLIIITLIIIGHYHHHTSVGFRQWDDLASLFAKHNPACRLRGGDVSLIDNLIDV